MTPLSSNRHSSKRPPTYVCAIEQNGDGLYTVRLLRHGLRFSVIAINLGGGDAVELARTVEDAPSPAYAADYFKGLYKLGFVVLLDAASKAPTAPPVAIRRPLDEWANPRGKEWRAAFLTPTNEAAP